MTRVLYVCSRNSDLDHLQAAIDRASTAMEPDNLVPRSPLKKQEYGVSLTAVNPPDDLIHTHGAICIGRLFTPAVDWSRIGEPSPDGSFTLIRWDEHNVELLSDAAGSRVLWFAQTDTLFIASSSVKAIVTLLGEFSFNREAASWFLATGTLGPQESWDNRVRRLPADSTLRLDRLSWTHSLKSTQVEFVSEQTPLGTEDLQYSLDQTFRSLTLPQEGSLLAVSGGYDSRYLLLRLQNHWQMRCVTWGSAAAPRRPRNDAAIAIKLTSTLNIPHEYLIIEPPVLGITDIVDRFIDESDGSIDHLAGYADGFAIWARLAESGSTVYIRGDEGFGWNQAFTVDQTRRDIGLTFIRDYFTDEQIERFGLSEIVLPECYRCKAGESLPTWRDRLYHNFRLPVVLGALNEAKSGYLDVINPLLSRTILSTVRKLPDPIRTEKLAFRQIVDKISPAVPYAREGANIRLDALLRSTSFVEAVEGELGTSHCDALSPAFRQHVVERLKVRSSTRTSPMDEAKRIVRRLLPASLKTAARAAAYRQIQAMCPFALALRVYTIARMHRILSAA